MGTYDEWKARDPRDEEPTGQESDCMRCEETFQNPDGEDFCPKCRENMNRTDMR